MTEAATKKLFNAIMARNETLAIEGINENAYFNRTVKQGDRTKITALHLAAQRGLDKVVEALIAKGHKVDLKDSEGWTPLHGAASEGYIQILKMLTNAGADVLAFSKKNTTALHLAIQNEQFDCVKHLLQCNPQLLSMNNDKLETPVHIAAIFKCETIFSYILNNFDVKEQLNQPNIEGEYPLHLMATALPNFCFSNETLNRVVQAGANPRAVNANHQTPSQYARGFNVNSQSKVLREQEFPLFYLCCKNIVSNEESYNQAKEDPTVPEEVKESLENVKKEIDIAEKMSGLKL